MRAAQVPAIPEMTADRKNRLNGTATAGTRSYPVCGSELIQISDGKRDPCEIRRGREKIDPARPFLFQTICLKTLSFIPVVPVWLGYSRVILSIHGAPSSAYECDHSPAGQKMPDRFPVILCRERRMPLPGGRSPIKNPIFTKDRQKPGIRTGPVPFPIFFLMIM